MKALRNIFMTKVKSVNLHHSREKEAVDCIRMQVFTVLFRVQVLKAPTNFLNTCLVVTFLILTCDNVKGVKRKGYWNNVKKLFLDESITHEKHYNIILSQCIPDQVSLKSCKDAQNVIMYVSHLTKLDIFLYNISVVLYKYIRV